MPGTCSGSGGGGRGLSERYAGLHRRGTSGEGRVVLHPATPLRQYDFTARTLLAEGAFPRQAFISLKLYRDTADS